jgi:hypothetical protein
LVVILSEAKNLFVPTIKAKKDLRSAQNDNVLEGATTAVARDIDREMRQADKEARS